MSSTKRGRSRKRHDTYPTPTWCVRRILKAVHLPGGQWLEPCAGNGAIIKAVNAEFQGTISWTACEIRTGPIPSLNLITPRIPKIITGNFFDVPPEQLRGYSVAITNPPFILASEFIERCIPMADHTLMLLRLNFVASEKRAEFMRNTRPDVYVLPNRPSFVGGGKTDSIEYAWFHWFNGCNGKMRVLDSTPKSERRGK